MVLGVRHEILHRRNGIGPRVNGRDISDRGLTIIAGVRDKLPDERVGRLVRIKSQARFKTPVQRFRLVMPFLLKFTPYVSSVLSAKFLFRSLSNTFSTKREKLSAKCVFGTIASKSA